MSEDPILGKVIDIIRPIARTRTDIQADTAIIQDGIIDSLSVINIIMEIERAFNLQIGAMDVTIDDFQTPEKIAQIIRRMQTIRQG